MATNKYYFSWRVHELSRNAESPPRRLKAVVSSFETGVDIEDEATISALEKSMKTGNSDSVMSDTLLQHLMASWRQRRQVDKWKHTTPSQSYRFLVKIYKPFNTFKSSKQLMQMVSDAFTGHRRLYESLGVIHGCVCPNNILVDEDGRGALVDWHHTKYKA